jgi:hypothetical protein
LTKLKASGVTFQERASRSVAKATGSGRQRRSEKASTSTGSERKRRRATFSPTAEGTTKTAMQPTK